MFNTSWTYSIPTDHTKYETPKSFNVVCPGSLVHFYTISIKLDKTSWIHNTHIQKFKGCLFCCYNVHQCTLGKVKRLLYTNSVKITGSNIELYNISWIERYNVK